MLTYHLSHSYAFPPTITVQWKMDENGLSLLKISFLSIEGQWISKKNHFQPWWNGRGMGGRIRVGSFIDSPLHTPQTRWDFKDLNHLRPFFPRLKRFLPLGEKPIPLEHPNFGVTEPEPATGLMLLESKKSFWVPYSYEEGFLQECPIFFCSPEKAPAVK